MESNIIYDTNGDSVIGTPGNEFQQTYADTCAIKSQQIILNEFGVNVTEDQCVRYSYEHGWYHGSGHEGTSLEDVGNLLTDGGIPNHQQMNADIFDIIDELSQGHKIIVGVDSDELWGDRFSGFLEDYYAGEQPDHAILVSGIDCSDPNNIQVLVTDPGNGDHNKAYPIDQFMDAWSDSECFMVATDDPVPSSSPYMENFDYGLGHLTDVAGMQYTDYQLFSDLSDSIPTYDMASDEHFSPMSSLVDAYFDVANDDLAFEDIFDDDNYSFNDYIDTDTATSALYDTYSHGVDQINFSDDMSWDNYADSHDYDMMTNDSYEDFLSDSIDYFNAVGDYDSASYCEQQLHILEYCDSNDIDFSDAFYDA